MKKGAVVLSLGLLLPLVVVVGLWCSLSWFLTREANRRLGEIPGYAASVGRVRVGLVPLRLMVRDLKIDKREEAAPAVFLTLASGTVEVSPGALLWGRWVLRVGLDRPAGRFLMRQRKPGQPRKFALWQRFFAKLPLFRISQLSITDGSLRLQNGEDIPPLDLTFDRIEGTVTHLSNRPGHFGKPPRLEGSARMMGQAPMTLVIETKPFQERVDFHLKGSLKGFDLSTLNPVLRHYTGVDLERGRMDVEGDLTASGGRFRGRVQRTISGLKVIGPREHHRGLVPLLKEAFLQAWLNRRKDDTGDITGGYALSGPLGYMNADVFLAGVWVAKSAFLQSLRPTLPPEVVMGSPAQAEADWMALQARERAKAAQKKL